MSTLPGFQARCSVCADLVGCCAFLAPTQEERGARAEALQRVTEVVQEIWPAASVEVFGSFVTGAALTTLALLAAARRPAWQHTCVSGCRCPDVACPLQGCTCPPATWMWWSWAPRRATHGPR